MKGKGDYMKVAVTWEMCGYVDIDADTMEEAMEKFDRESDYIKLPTNGEYVDGSFQLSSDDVEEMEAMSE
jgi:hypothetical protein